MDLQFPHCDAKVLHAPGECVYCDRRPEWQELRKAWGIAFTGQKNATRKAWVDGELKDVPALTCPSEIDRPLETINAWPGNRASI
jgi:hypothetical protein